MANVDNIVRKILYAPARLWLRRKPLSLPLNPASIRKVLLVRTDAIGDMIVTTPMLELLKKRLNATIDVVASPANAILVQDDPRVRNTFVFDGSITSLLQVRRSTRRERYDLVIALVMHKTTRGGLYANLWAGRSAVTATFAHQSRKRAYGTWFSAQVDVDFGTTTMADMQIQMLNQLFGWHVDPSATLLSLHLPETAEVEWKGRPRIVLNLSSGKSYRMWSAERNAQCIELLHEKFTEAHIMIMAHGEQKAMAHALVRKYAGFADLLPETSDVRYAIASMRGADVVITPDTSMVHGAAALGIPVVGMFSHKTSFLNQWMPHGVPYRALIAEGREDIETIEPSLVVEAVAEVLSA